MAVSVVFFSFSSAAQPEAQRPSSLLDDGFLYCILSPTGLQNSIGGPQGPLGRKWLPLQHLISNFSGPQLIRAPSPFGLVWLALPHLVSNSVRSLTVCLLVLTELYNSSTSTQSPTQSLEWHVWLSSSGTNCHAVQRSLSSGASVYECIMAFTLSHFISQIRPRDLFRLLAIGLCHFLPVHHLGMACLAGSKVKIQHTKGISAMWNAISLDIWYKWNMIYLL